MQPFFPRLRPTFSIQHKAVLNLAWPTLVNSYNCPSDAKLYRQCPHATTDLVLHYYRGARVPEMVVPQPQGSTL